MIEKKFIWFILLLTVFSCSRQENDMHFDFYHIRCEGVDLPLLVKGNLGSNYLLLYVNGGPGLTSIDIAESNLLGWEAIENEILMAYYDQRGTGNAQGVLDTSQITVDRYMDDLNTLVDFLAFSYPGRKIILMGHSFGGYLASKYLIELMNSNVKGLIAIDAPFTYQVEILWSHRREFLGMVTDEKLAENPDDEKWNEADQWLAENSSIESSEQKKEWRSFIGWGGEDVLPDEIADLSAGQVMRILFFSSYNIFPAYLSDNLKLTADLLYPHYANDNLFDQLNEISIPVLMIWGKYDDLVPYFLAERAKMMFGTSKDSLFLKVYPESSHEPYLSAPLKFTTDIITFTKGIK